MRWCALAVLVLGSPAVLSADLLIVEKTLVKMGNRAVEGVRSTQIQASRMRIDWTQAGKTATTIYDLPAGEMLELETANRKANVRAVTARNQKLEKEFPRHETTVTVTATGASQSIAGEKCDDHALTVRVLMITGKSVFLTMNGTACLAAADSSAVADYRGFAKAAIDQNLVLGQATDNVILLAVARGQTELYRAMAPKGIPLITDVTIAVEGTGMLAGIIRKGVSSQRVTTVTKLESAPRDAALFAVPAGWKRDLKK